MQSFVVFLDYLLFDCCSCSSCCWSMANANQDTQRKYFKLLPPQKEQKNGWLL
jgi:hypothetical protein